MSYYGGKSIWEKTFDISVFLSLKGLVVFLGFLFFFIATGCDKPYLPWVAGPSWGSSGNETPQARREQVPQREIEDFCRDNRETVEAYRRFLEPDFDWGVSASEEERRRRYTQQFVEEYDERCNE